MDYTERKGGCQYTVGNSDVTRRQLNTVCKLLSIRACNFISSAKLDCVKTDNF